jgi:PAS domain S-box-containing protein
VKADLPPREAERLAYLHTLDILDTPREQSFDDIVQLVSSICAVPIALVSLIDDDRQWFKSCLGLSATETPRDLAFCAHAILTPEDLLVVEDALLDPRFSDNPLVTGEPHIRFYAGAPLVTREGLALGTLCAIDYVPRRLDPAQIQALALLAGQVIQLLQLREANLILEQERKLIAASEQKLSILYSQAPVAIVLNDATHGRFLDCNPEFARMVGYGLGEILGMTYLTMTPAEYVESDKREKQSLLENGRYGPYEKLLIHKNGQLIPVLMNGVLIDTPAGGRHIWTFIQDITERKRIEQMKNEFVSAVSHELRTPLTSISGSLGLIASGMLGSLPDNVHGMLSIAHKNAQRLTLLINDLLDMEKILAGKMAFDMQVQALPPILQTALEANKAYADSFGIRLFLQVEEADLPVNIDSRRLQQVLANFISNAIKFSPEGGQVDITLSRQNDCVKIAVIDRGPGISEEFRARIFQKFSQADSSDSRQRGGTGLGLAISKALVEKMDGSIGFESALGKGSTFFALFPIYRHDRV